MHRQFLIGLGAVLCFTAGAATVAKKTFPYSIWAQLRPYDDGQSTFRRERAAFFDHFTRPADVAMVGDSIVSDVDWREVWPDLSVANRGVRGDTTHDVLNRIPGILAPHPSKVALLVGINDLDNGDRPEDVAERYRAIVERIRPHAQVLAVSTLPCSPRAGSCARLSPKIRELNARIAAIPGVTYVDAGAALSENGRLREAYTYDGVHLNVAGFRVLVAKIEPFLRTPASQSAPRAPRSSPSTAAPPG